MHAYGDPIEREVPRDGTRHVDHPHAEVGIRDIRGVPGAAPGVGRAVQDIVASLVVNVGVDLAAIRVVLPGHRRGERGRGWPGGR